MIVSVNKASVVNFCELIIRWSFILLFFLVPLIFTPYSYELFEYNKMMLTYGLTAIITASFIIKNIALGKLEIKRTPFDILLILFLLSQILSTIFSIDWHTSLFGYYSRFHGGLFSTISYLLLYYIFVTQFINNKNFLIKCLNTSLFSGLFISFYAILQRLGADKSIWVQDVQNRVFSTLGQPNWLAAYFAVLILIATTFFLQEKKVKNLFYLITAGLFYLVIIFTKSRSGFTAFWFGFLVFSLLAFLREKVIKIEKKTNIKGLATLFVLFLFLSFVYGTTFSQLESFTLNGIRNQMQKKLPKEEIPVATPVNTTLEYGGTESGTIRKIVWQGAIDIIKHYPVFGSGVETFAYSYYKFRPQAHNLTSEWDFLYNKAHNEYLNFAATCGIVGLLTYLIFIFAYIFWALQKICKTKESGLLLCGFLAAFFSILISNFFGFSVVVIGIFFFLIPAFSFVLISSDGEKYFTKKLFESNSHLSLLPKTAIFIVLCILCYLLFNLTKMWRADKFFNLGYQHLRANQYSYAFPYLKKAIELNPNEPTFIDEFVQAEAVLSLAFSEQKDEQVSDELKNDALARSDKLVTQYPNNVNFAKTRTKVLYTLSEADPALKEQALSAILKAWQLAPNDAKIAYNVGLLYAKNGQTDKAIQTLLKAIELKPNYYEPHWALALFYEQLNEKEKAVDELNLILTKIRLDDQQAKEKLDELAK